MKNRLIKQRGPAEVGAVLQIPIGMPRPEGESHVIERNDADAVVVVLMNNVLDVSVSPVRGRSGVVDRHALQLHAVGVSLARPVAVRGGEVLRGGLSPEDAHLLLRVNHLGRGGGGRGRGRGGGGGQGAAAASGGGEVVAGNVVSMVLRMFGGEVCGRYH